MKSCRGKHRKSGLWNPAYLKELCEVWRGNFSQHVALRETLPFVSATISNQRWASEPTISAKSANRTQNFSSWTASDANGCSGDLCPKNVAGLSTPSSYTASDPILM